MRILVYPHDLNMGGSQMNAIELAAAVRDLGHHCVVYGRRGVLCDRIRELDLEFIASPDPGRRPSVRVARDLREVAAHRGIDVIHGYEWPPGLEAGIASRRWPSVASVCTVMSMAVAPFIPRWMPLIVGTAQIAAYERANGRPVVHLLEPPVDLHHNKPMAESALTAFRNSWSLHHRPIVACVGRLATELKAEGVLAAIDVAGRSAAGPNRFHLLLVGDGPARPLIESAAADVNRRAGENIVVLTGELSDPRPAYAVADVVLGMGGSALRSLAFSKPLIVQGEHGFYKTLSPATSDIFLWQGWYGVGEGSSVGSAKLAAELDPLLRSEDERRRLGEFGRELVERFSIERAAEKQLQIYRETVDATRCGSSIQFEDLRAGSAFVTHYAKKKAARLTGHRQADDFNAHPVAGLKRGEETAPRNDSGMRRGVELREPLDAASGSLVYFAGVDWDAVVGTDRMLVQALAQKTHVIWVDPPQSVWSAYRRGVDVPRISDSAYNVTRLHTYVPPGVSRTGIREISEQATVRNVKRFLRAEQIVVFAAIASGTQSFLSRVAIPGVRKIFFATDDMVAGARLWGMSPDKILKDREANLRAADLTLAVTPELAGELRREDTPVRLFPNGFDEDRYRDIDTIPPAADVWLERPIIGVFGQFNERTDLTLLRAVQEAGLSLLLVGPRYFATREASAAFQALVASPRVQYIDRVSPSLLPGYMKALRVGLTPYVDSAFNRRSFPLKTLDYLAAGVPVVASDVAPVADLDPRFVRTADGPCEFTEKIIDLLGESYSPREIQLSVDGLSWTSRATELFRILSEIESGQARTGKGTPWWS